MFEVKRYTPEDKSIWDKYVDKARNATFLFHRDYMDYHADRFRDHSLLFIKTVNCMPYCQPTRLTIHCTHTLV